MKSILIVFLYTVATLGAGVLSLKLAQRCLIRKDERHYYLGGIGVIFAVGCAVLATLWQLVALGTMLRSGVVWTVVLLLCGATVMTITPSSSRSSMRRGMVDMLALFRDNWLVAAVAATSVVVLAWLGVLAYVRPPFGDADAFYFVYSKIIAETGAIAPMAGNYRDFSAVGLSGELHFAALQVIGTPEGAKLFAWVTGIGLLILLRDITKAVGGGGVAQTFAVVMLLTSTTYSDYLSDGKVDLFPACSALAAVLLLLGDKRNPTAPADITLAGFLTGVSLTAKFSYVVAFLPVMGLLGWFYLSKREDNDAPLFSKKSLGLLALFSIALILGSAPHLLKNYLLFGQPLAPFVGMKANWAEQNWFSSADTAWIAATYPIALVFGQYPMQGGNLSVLWLAALPLALFLVRRVPYRELLTCPLFRITIAALIGVLCWLAVKASVLAPRYILATLILLFPLAAVSIERVWLQEVRSRIVAFGFVTLAMLTLLALPFTPPADVWTAKPKFVAGHMRNGSPACGLAISSYCSGFVALNEKVREGERVFLAGYYSYFLRADALQCINESDDFAIFTQTNPTDVWATLYTKGFAHIAVQKATHGHILKILDPREAPPWLAVSVDFADSDMPIFHIRALDKKQRPSIVCMPAGRKSWAPRHTIAEAD